MAKLKLYICSQPDYLQPFSHLFTQVDSLDEADVVMFTGGHDVHPSFYGEPVGKHTFTWKARDISEAHAANYAIKHSLPMLGICRGAQFLTVIAGGKLVQDVTHHCQPHSCYTTDEDCEFVMSSTHHQMMNPYLLDNKDYKVIAYARHRSKHYLDGHNKPIPHCGIDNPRGFNPSQEPEIVWYPKIRALAIQGHPEIMPADSEGVAFCQQLAKEYLC